MAAFAIISPVWNQLFCDIVFKQLHVIPRIPLRITLARAEVLITMYRNQSVQAVTVSHRVIVSTSHPPSSSHSTPVFTMKLLAPTSSAPLRRAFSRLSAAAVIFGVAAGLCLMPGAVSSLHAQSPGAPAAPSPIPREDTKWSHAGWGGGGYYYAAAFHPTRQGTIYLGGDVAGMYKSVDGGKSFKLINNGIADYGVFTIAVDPSSPDTVYAATENGLCKSTNAGEEWTILPQTGRKELRITGEKGKSIRCVAVDPTDSNTVYAGSPGGKLFKSTDGGLTWKVSYEKDTGGEVSKLGRVQFGKVNGAYFGGFWSPVAYPEGVASGDTIGFGFRFQGDGTTIKDAFLMLRTTSGETYRSKNLRDIFLNTAEHDVILRADDFVIDPEYVKKSPDKAKTAPATPEWGNVNRFDFAVSGPLPDQSAVGRFGEFFFAATRASDGRTGTAEQPVTVPVLNAGSGKPLATYGNIRTGEAAAGPVFTVSVSPKNTSHIAAATGDTGVIISTDKGATWTATKTPARASCVAWDPASPTTLYAAFFSDGVMRSEDMGKTWTTLSSALPPKLAIKDIAINPVNPRELIIIGTIGWNGQLFRSEDAGATWTPHSTLTADKVGDPTLPAEGKDGKTPLSSPTNVVFNPQNPLQVYVSANWRPALSEDGGKTWSEAVAGADISCITDVRFHKGKVYVTAMDEGTLMSEDNGKSWKQLWPEKFIDALSGHNWRVAVVDDGGAAPRIVSTVSPWHHASHPNKVVVSEDGGKTYNPTLAGLPAYVPKPNTMWGQGYGRALAVDPSNPKVLYMGIDGDPTPGNADEKGGGIFRSDNGGYSWTQLASQPSSRRMFYGLAVDPTDSKRIFWGACGENGGVHRTEDGGATWKRVFTSDTWIWNLEVTSDGTIYAAGKELFRSTDHGATWKQVSRFNNGMAVVGLAVNPNDPKTIWVSCSVWNGNAKGGVFKTTDGGANWVEITGDIPIVRPLVLRYNAEAGELWAAGVGLWRVKQ
ncbi:hypothetical protein DB346_09590 [Verrucomicrobia bacterium LW23]|nr:hypothetical protein DB346_09590 [Verrucomicrobia bacterium LW23]